MESVSNLTIFKFLTNQIVASALSLVAGSWLRDPVSKKIVRRTDERCVRGLHVHFRYGATRVVVQRSFSALA